MKTQKWKGFSHSAGFEPAWGDPIGFQVQRLNHSATNAAYQWVNKLLTK